MKIHKALKVKNRLAGEVAGLQEIFKRENSRRNDNASQVDASKVKNSLDAKREELFKLKGAIAQATAPITPKLAELEERKAEKNFLSGIPTREGEEVNNALGGRELVRYQWSATINREGLDELLTKAQENINKLQDEIDEFNAKTDVVL